MFRLPTQNETLEAWARMERAMDGMHPVRVAYLRQMRTPKGSPRYFARELPAVSRVYGRRPMLRAQPSVRVCEPFEFGWSAGMPYVCVLRAPRGGETDPQIRTVRLDRIIVMLPDQRLRLDVLDQPCVYRGTAFDPTVTLSLPATLGQSTDEGHRVVG
jgi:hypothetical protein